MSTTSRLTLPGARPVRAGVPKPPPPPPRPRPPEPRPAAGAAPRSPERIRADMAADREAAARRHLAMLDEAVVTLLQDDRPQMALRVARGLPDAIRDALAAARAEGVRARPTRPATASSRTSHMPRKPTPTTTSAPAAKPGFAREAAALREQVERLGAERVAEALMVRIEDLGPLLEGRVGIAWAAIRRLRRTP